MIQEIPNVLAEIASLVPKGVAYPRELLSSFDLQRPLDREVYNYIVQGGEAGGYYHWLTLLARHSGAGLIVELGNRHGASTLALYHGLSAEGRLLSIDIVRDQRYVPQQVFQDPQVRFLLGDALDLTIYERAGLEIPRDIDVLWTDTVHCYKQIAAEFRVYEPLLADEALVVIDDIRLNDKGRFFEEAPYPKYDLTSLCHSSGFGALHYTRPAHERGRSWQERLWTALKRSTQVGFENYWDLHRQYEILDTAVRKHPVLKVQRKLQTTLQKWMPKHGPRASPSHAEEDS